PVNSAAHHRVRHAFPTRRSSDLVSSMSACTECARGSVSTDAGAASCSPCQPGYSSAEDRRSCQPCAAGFFADFPHQYPCSACQRSEEHTSELQSRENLVCRLLLE